MRADRAGRAARGALAGSLTTLLALSFHVFGGGVAPDAVAIVGSLLAAIWVCTMLAGRALKPWLLVVAVTVAQLVLHTVFSMSTATVLPFAVPAAGHAHGDVAIGAVLHGGHAMWIAHVLAGVATIAVVLLGDRMLTAAAEVGSRIVRRILVAMVTPAPPSTPIAPLPSAPLALTLADRAVAAVSRRGPPVIATA